MRRRNMHPLAFLLSGSTSHHHGMWRHPGDRQPVPGPDYYERVAIVLELGMFDALFFADVLARCRTLTSAASPPSWGGTAT